MIFDPTFYQAAAIRSGLKLFLRTGIKPNTQWTLTNMLATAGRITKRAYKRTEGWQAVEDLTAWLEEARV
jgi:hypothetical protein